MQNSPANQAAAAPVAAACAASTAADRHPTRRTVLGAALAGAGAATIAATGLQLATKTATGGKETPTGTDTISCHGKHQAGIISPATSHTRLLAFNLHQETDTQAIKRLLRVLTADIEALTQGVAPLADTEPQLALLPARLTVTVGFGAELIARISPNLVPDWLKPLPAFSTDKLDPAYCDGDLLLVIAADDQLAVSHAARVFTRAIRSFAKVAWIQDGFRHTRNTTAPGTTMRNLMGQVDGTVNPNPEKPDFAPLVWHTTGAFAGGTCLVLRRIRMELDTWEQVDRHGREATIGRTLANGAPLTGKNEHDAPDFERLNELGLPVIPAFAHIRRAHSTNPGERIYRRSLNYDTGSEQGLLFICYQQDPRKQFVPIQQRLADLDLLNQWITHTGSAVFAIAPGWHPGEIIGQQLFAHA